MRRIDMVAQLTELVEERMQMPVAAGRLRRSGQLRFREFFGRNSASAREAENDQKLAAGGQAVDGGLTCLPCSVW